MAAPVLSASTTLGGALLLKGFAPPRRSAASGSNRGALIAGWIIGLTEASAALLLSPGYQNGVMLLVVHTVLLVRPGGIVSSLEARTV
jgi:branched-chain amino acid transport system permease protein